VSGEASEEDPRGRGGAGLVGRWLALRPGEGRTFAWAFACSFSVLAAWYVLRPLRETFGVESGPETLQWLFTGTFVVMLAAVPAFSWLVARSAPRTFVPVVYHLFAANLVLFWTAFAFLDDGWTLAAARAFFVWTSVFNLFAVSVFWALMVDLLREEQCKRLFGALAAGGTVGGLLGSGTVTVLAGILDPVHLLWLAVLLLELAVLCVRRLARSAAESGTVGAQRVGGGVWAGFRLALRSPYLLGICAYMLLATWMGTTVYFQQAGIVEAALPERGQRAQLFSGANFATQALTVLVQAFLAARAIRWFGVGATLAVLPIVTLTGFVVLGLGPTLAIVVGFDVLRRATSYGLAKPTKEVLWSVVGREEKYKAKSFVDLVVYRGGDTLGGWGYEGLRTLGMGVAAIAWVSVPIAALWAFVSLALGRRERELAQRGSAASAPLSAPASSPPSV
jgi:AAA family ATP:ADP antiporter